MESADVCIYTHGATAKVKCEEGCYVFTWRTEIDKRKKKKEIVTLVFKALRCNSPVGGA